MSGRCTRVTGSVASAAALSRSYRLSPTRNVLTSFSVAIATGKNDKTKVTRLGEENSPINQLC